MPRPKMIGTLIRQIDMNHRGTTPKGRPSNKDYRIRITLDSTSGTYRVYTEYGPAGNLQNGKEIAVPTPTSHFSADRLADDLMNKKMIQADAYLVIGDHPVPRSVIPPSPSIAPSAPIKPRPNAPSIDSLSDASRKHIHQFF